MPNKLSPMQSYLIDLLRSSRSRTARPEGGGYWQIDGLRVNVGSSTVYSLERREVLRRLHEDERHWKDGYELPAELE